MKRSLSFMLAGCMAILASSFAHAGMIYYEFLIDPDQAGHPGLTAIGTGRVSLDTDTNLLSWNIEYSNLSGPVLAAHFHGPAGYDQNAPPRITLNVAQGSPLVDSTVISDAFEQELLGGLWYVNVHTAEFSGGEIRGQVVPEPAFFGLAALAAAGLLRRRRSAK